MCCNKDVRQVSLIHSAPTQYHSRAPPGTEAGMGCVCPLTTPDSSSPNSTMMGKGCYPRPSAGL